MINKSAKILGIGGSSLDTLNIKGKDHSSPGGAGLYTALAAAKSGADVTLLSPFPSPVPATLLEFSAHVKWIGPEVSPDELPRFHIVHANGETKYKRSFFGAEGAMTAEDCHMIFLNMIWCILSLWEIQSSNWSLSVFVVNGMQNLFRQELVNP